MIFLVEGHQTARANDARPEEDSLGAYRRRPLVEMLPTIFPGTVTCAPVRSSEDRRLCPSRDMLLVPAPAPNHLHEMASRDASFARDRALGRRRTKNEAEPVVVLRRSPCGEVLTRIKKQCKK